MCDRESNPDSGFVFGLVIGAIIGAVVAIYIYKNNRDEIFGNLKKRLENLFKESKKPAKKIPVSIPKNIASVSLKPAPAKKPAKLFRK